MADPLPQVLWYCFELHPKRSGDVTADQVGEAYERLVRGEIITTVRSPIMGESRMCWHNVGRAVKRKGGSLVMGWSICPDEEPRLPQRNRFARLALNAHCVWLHRGVYYECSPDRVNRTTQFIVGDIPQVNATVEFYDDLDSLLSIRQTLPTCNGWPPTPYQQVYVPLTGV